jgi:hypothetical protein
VGDGILGKACSLVLGRVILSPQKCVMKAKRFFHHNDLAVSKAFDVVLVGLREEGHQIHFIWKLCNAICVFGDPAASVLKYDCILLSLDRCLSGNLIASANVTENEIQKRGTLDPKVNGIKEVVEISPRSRVPNRGSNMGQIRPKDIRHSSYFIIQIRANDRRWRRAIKLTLCSSPVVCGKESRSIVRNVVIELLR